MAANYKLNYFNVKGRAEAIRFLFHYAGVPFTDNRVQREQWPAMKPTTPMGQMPVLEEDSKQLCQSVTILRYLAKKFDLVGSNAFESAQADMYVDGIQDLISNTRPLNMAIMQGESEEKLKELYAKMKTEFLASFLDRYEKFLAANGGKHLVGQKTTWADIVLGELLGRIEETWDADLLKGHANLAALKKSIYENAGVKSYVAGRPATKM